jgi:membrane protease YdiL (CAAX protease family)
MPTVMYVGLLTAFWITARFLDVERHIGGHLTSSFAAFAFLFAPYWFFGFGLAQALRDRLRTRAIRILLPGSLVLAYMMFALPRGDVRLPYALAMLTIPVGLAALFELFPPAVNALTWQDVVALLIIGLPAEFGWLRPAWPQSGMGSMPKLLLVDAGLYAFLVVRGLEWVGYDFRFRQRDLVVGFREWAFFAPFGIGIGLALRFIFFHGWTASGWTIAAGWLVTFVFVAVPEEFYFRGLLQNLLEPRVGRQGALMLAATIFGLSHFNKPLPFAWRYVLLATIAGVFYGRAWREQKRLASSAITHTAVDVVWSVWFR